MSRKKSKATAGSPVFKWVDGKPIATWNVATGEGAEALEKWLKGRTRTALSRNIEAMRSAALASNTEQARTILDRLPRLIAAIIGGGAPVATLLLDAMLVAQAFTELRIIESPLPAAINQARQHNARLKVVRPKQKTKCDPKRIKRVLAMGFSVKGEMKELGVKRSTINAYRKRFGKQSALAL